MIDDIFFLFHFSNYFYICLFFSLFPLSQGISPILVIVIVELYTLAVLFPDNDEQARTYSATRRCTIMGFLFYSYPSSSLKVALGGTRKVAPSPIYLSVATICRHLVINQAIPN